MFYAGDGRPEWVQVIPAAATVIINRDDGYYRRCRPPYRRRLVRTEVPYLGASTFSCNRGSGDGLAKGVARREQAVKKPVYYYYYYYTR